MTWPESDGVDESHRRLPLAGVKVLDLCRIVAGPFAAMILGDLGADVIKVERPGGGDEPRRWGPPFHGENSAYFMAINRNRRSLTVDLTTEPGRAIVTKLAQSADIVLENFLPAQARRLGIDVVQKQTSAVWVSIRAAGSNGPDGDQPGVDAAIQARAGLMSINGFPETGPTKVGVPVVDMFAGLYAVVAALAGLIRAASGAVARMEVPLLECAVSALLNQAANYLVSGVTPRLTGNDHPNLAPYGPFPTADGQIFLAATSDLQFQRLCQMLGREDLLRNVAFASNAGRVIARDAVVSEISEATSASTTAELLDAAGRSGVLAAPVNTVAQALDDDLQIKAVDLIQDVTTAAGPTRIVGSPLLIDGERPPVRFAPPEVGQHTNQILESLGYSEDDIARLRQDHIC